MGHGYYRDHTSHLRNELKGLDPETLRDLHHPNALRHFLVVGRQALLLALAVWVILKFDSWWLWLPASALIGLIVFDCTVLLHEVVHFAVFRRHRAVLYSLLGWAYALPSGISRTQFTKWHLDHHDELGDEEADPKRHHLTPKIVRRWYKFLYMTPALFPIYFRAAGREASTYPAELQRRIRFERWVTIAAHLGTLAALWIALGPALAVKLYVVPVFFCFPVWFTLNRLGQHYDVNPEDPAAWATVIRPSRLWEFLFLWSNYHSEHHFFPSVPMYRLRRLHQLLRPVYDAHGVPMRTYRWLLWKWFVENRTPHTDWSGSPEKATGASAGARASA